MLALASGAVLLGGIASLGREFVGVGLDAVGNSKREYGSEYVAAMAGNLAADVSGLAASAGTLATLAGRHPGAGFARATLQVTLQEFTGLPEHWDDGVWRDVDPENGFDDMGDEERLRPADGSPILWALAVVDGLELTTGFGSPVDGEDFKVGSERFTALSTLLRSAIPDDHWIGDSSQTYSGQVAEQRRRVWDLARLDRQLAAIVKDQAGWNTTMRLGLGLLKGLLMEAYLVEVILRMQGDAFFPAATIFSRIAAGLGVIVGVGMLSTLGVFSLLNAKEADALAARYGAPATSLVATDTRVQVELHAVAESPAGTFNATPIRESRVGWALAQTSRPPDGESGIQRDSAPRAAGGAGEIAGASAAAQPVASTASLSAMSILAELAASSGHGVKLTRSAVRADQTAGSPAAAHADPDEATSAEALPSNTTTTTADGDTTTTTTADDPNALTNIRTRSVACHG